MTRTFYAQATDAAANVSACSTGIAYTACGSGLTGCAGACVDLRTDTSHCGACGNPCGPGAPQCVAGACRINFQAATYTSAHVRWDFSGFGTEELRFSSGTVAFDGIGGLTTSTSEVGASLAPTCSTAGGPCNLSYGLTPRTPSSESFSGTYEITSQGSVLIASPATPTVVRGFTNPAGTMFLFPSASGDSQGGEISMFLAFQEPTNLAPPAVPTTYNVVGHSVRFNVGTQPFATETSFGTVTLDPSGTFSVDVTAEAARQDFTCSGDATGCSFTTAITRTSESGTMTGTYTISPNGEIVVMTPPPDAGSSTGRVSADGRLLRFAAFESSPNDARTSWTLGVRQGSGLPPAALQGTSYNLILVTHRLRDDVSIESSLSVGRISFGAPGVADALSLSLADVQNFRQWNCIAANPSCFGVANFQTDERPGESSSAAYVVDGTGKVTITVPDPTPGNPPSTLFAWVSDDAGVLLLPIPEGFAIGVKRP
jgi:hypothetical protein